MNHSKPLVFLFALGAVGAAPASPPVTASAMTPLAVTAVASSPSICHATASAERQAARRDAQAEYWIAVAKCLNAPDSSECEDAAKDARDEAFELANEQYQARLDACGMLGQGAYDPQIDPHDFSSTVDNAYMPLVVGRTLVYEQHSAAGVEHVEVTTLPGTVDIDGVRCTKVHDVVMVDGVVIEDTLDFFAQKQNGDAWYFGEISQSFDEGFLDNLDGSWRTGKDGAKPGIAMLANAQVGDVYRQEFDLGNAEDASEVISLNGSATVPAATCASDCLVTEETTALSPDALENKYYKAGVGVILEVKPETGERTELIEIIN